jgi:Lrp/AsnC family transcriptional regulator, leucine-responsive regulatory protein
MSCYGSRCVLKDPEILAWSKVLEIHRITGPECCLIKVVGTSLEDYEQTIDRLGQVGQPTSMIVLSSPVRWRKIQPPE